MKNHHTALVNHYEFWILAVITSLAAGLRLYKLGEWSFWIDEIYTVERALGVEDYLSLNIPISRILISASLQLLSGNEFSARLAPALIGIVTIPVLYFLIRKYLDTTTALISVFLLALSSWHLYWSQNARFYTTLMLLYIVAQFVFLFYLESNRTSTLFFVFILVALSIREKATALVLIPVLIADLIVFNILQVGESRKFPWKVLAVGGTLIILLGGYLIFRDLSKLAAKFFAFSSNPLRLSLSIVYEIGIPLFVVAATAGVFYLQKKNCRGLLLLLGAIIPPILLFMISPFALTNSRHVFVILPNWVILGALGVKEVYANIRGHARIFAVGLFLLLVIFSVSQDYLYFAYQNGNRPDWKGSYELVMKQKSAEDIVVSTRPGVGTYYLGERVLWNQNFDIVRINDFNGKVWFVLDYSISYIPPELQEFLDNKTRLVDVRDTFLPGKSMQVRVYVYEPGT